MDKQVVEQRVEELQKAVEQSASNHHVLCGHLQEAKFMLEQMNKVVDEAKEGEVLPASDL